MEVISDKEPTVCQIPGSALDSQLMEGITFTELSLDSRPREGSSCQEPVEQSILLSPWTVSPRECVMKQKLEWEPEIIPAINRNLDSRSMEGTTYLERPAPAVYLDSWLMKGASYPQPHVDWEVLSSNPSLNNVAIVKMVDTDASDDVNTHLPENVTPVSTAMTSLAWPCVDSPRLPTVKHEIVNRMKDSREMKMTQPESAPPTIDPNVTLKNMPENLTPVSTPMTALAWPCVNSPLLPTVKPEIVNRMKDSHEVKMTSPENAPPTIDPNVSMKYWQDGVCHPLIYAGDFPQNVLKTNSHNPEAANIQHEADEIYTGRTATQTRRWLDVEDNLDTDSIAELEHKTWDDARTWEFRNARGNTNVSLSQNSRMETKREYVSDVDTDTYSDAELDYKAKKCAFRTWKCRCAPADVAPADVPPADVTEKCEHEEWINRNVHSPWICANHQHGWEYSSRQIYDSMDVAEWYPVAMDCLRPEEGNCLSHAVCDDSVALMPLIQITRVLFSNGGDAAGGGGHDGEDDGSPAGLFRCLPRCLYWPWSLHGMTQCQVKIKGPSMDRLTRVMVDNGGLWDIRSSVTLPAMHAGMEICPTIIGLQASINNLAVTSDLLCVPPGGIWIGFMGRTVEHGQSIVAVAVIFCGGQSCRCNVRCRTICAMGRPGDGDRSLGEGHCAAK